MPPVLSSSVPRYRLVILVPRQAEPPIASVRKCMVGRCTASAIAFSQSCSVFPGLSMSIRSPLVRLSGHTVQTTFSARRLRVAPPRALRPAYFSSFAMAYSLHRPARYAAGGGGGGFGGRPWIHRTQSRDRSLCANGQRTCDAGGDP